MRTKQRRAALIVATIALSMPGASLFAQPRQVPPQRGSPPGPETPYILVTAFRAPNKQLAVQAADELRDRLKQEHSARELFVLTKTSVEGTLTASGYPVDSALNTSDLMELAKQMRGEYVTEAWVKKGATGGAVHVDSRILMKTGQQIVAQPLPGIDAKDVGDAARQLDKSITEALKQIPAYKECVAGLRAGRFEDAAARARAGIALYPKAAWSRVCLLNAYASGKTAPPDSIISLGNAILVADSTSVLALANLADAYIAKGDNDKAIDVMLRMYALEPNRKTLESILPVIAKGAPEKGIQILTNLIKENPGDAELVRNKWLLELKVGRLKAALATGEELAKLDTAATTSDYFTRMIGAAQADSNQAKIADLASKASQKFPRDVSFPLLLAQTYRRMGQLQQARHAAGRATDIDPKNTNAWLFAIVVSNEMNQADSAMALAKKAIVAGADKTQIGPTLLGPVGAAIKKAQESKERADWEASLVTARSVDSVAPSQASKFYIGLAQFQVGLEALQNANKLGQDKGKDAKESKTKACIEAKLVEELWANATIAMTSGGGGAYNKESAGAVMGAIQQYNQYIEPLKKQNCAAK